MTAISAGSGTWVYNFLSNGRYTSTYNGNWEYGYSGTYTYTVEDGVNAQIILNGSARDGYAQTEKTTVKIAFLTAKKGLGSIQQSYGTSFGTTNNKPIDSVTFTIEN